MTTNKPQRGQWMSFLCECDICGRLWAGIAPIGTVQAECPGCGHFAAIPDGQRIANELADGETGEEQ